MKITVDLTHLNYLLDLHAYEDRVKAIDKMIVDKSGPGNDFLGWVNLPSNIDQEELKLLKKTAAFVKENYDVLVVCGIGGSYLGARACNEAINGTILKTKPEIIYLGQTFNPTYISEVLTYLKDKKFAVNVISKSGTTTETSVSFRLLKEFLEQRDGKEEAKKAIIATTDKEHGALLTLCKQEGYVRFVLPADVGGRYSVLTPVGLFPLAVAGLDIDDLLEGARDAEKEYNNPNLLENEAYKYAVARHALYAEKGLKAEFLVSYAPYLVQFAEWWKQLYGESEGKDHKSLLPISATFTTDLHSLGQFIQQGSPVFFETILHLNHEKHEVKVPGDKDNLDGLNYLEGKTLSFIQEKAFEGTLMAHSESAKVDNIVINIDRMDEKNLGHLIYFFEKACAMSAYLNGVNPFDQPGVEIYKKNMFHLLGKPGF